MAINLTFKDEIGTDLNRYTITDVATGETKDVRLNRKANITQQGTPLNATNLNKIVEGINNVSASHCKITNRKTYFQRGDSIDFPLEKKLILTDEWGVDETAILVPTYQGTSFVEQNNSDVFYLEIPFIDGEFGGEIEFQDDRDGATIPIFDYYPVNDRENIIASGNQKIIVPRGKNVFELRGYFYYFNGWNLKLTHYELGEA